ncbi:hypothetical protein [Paenibacillus glycinis]|uniref:Uncharacterized protein n=1 Tax=Paenibacillus glycinis TaxID=2697035 RepID=A0ABW9XZB4_9BACL|nr:hypothetical protein [Paenibacillus glycinis]NBD28021.1 hypothetical protein [Paenibacillus glycinis]
MIMLSLLFLAGISSAAGIQFRYMRHSASPKDVMIVSFLLLGSAVLGFLMIWHVPILSPSVLLRRWLMFFVD